MTASGRARAALRSALDEPLVAVRWRARLLRPYRVLRFRSFGAGSILHRPEWVYGPHHIVIGRRSLLLQSLWLAAERVTWARSGPAIVIGDRVTIRSHCTISASESVVIEDDVVVAGYCSIIDCDHTWDAGRPSVLQNPVRTAPIRIGRGTWVGDRVAVLRGADIGRFCIIGANSVVSGEVPDFSIAVGSPARVVGRTHVPGMEEEP